MSSVPRRRPVLPGMLQWSLRLRFWERLADDSRYQAVIAQDLRPLWNATGIDGPCTWCMVARYARRTRDDAAMSYVTAVQAAAKSLGLTWRGAPAAWLLEQLHHDALTWPDLFPGGIGGSTVMHEETAEIEMRVSPSGATIELVTDAVTRINRDGTKEHRDTRKREDVRPAQFMSFVEWDEAERRAKQLVEEWFAGAKTRYRAMYGNRNAASVAGYYEDAALLAEWVLTVRIPEIPPRRNTGAESAGPVERLQEIATSIEIDTPPLSR